MPVRLYDLWEGEWGTVGDSQLFLDNVQPRCLFCDRMLNLEPGVYLEEGDRSIGAYQEFDGPGALVASSVTDATRGCFNGCSLSFGDECCWRFLDQLLVSSLH